MTLYSKSISLLLLSEAISMESSFLRNREIYSAVAHEESVSLFFFTALWNNNSSSFNTIFGWPVYWSSMKLDSSNSVSLNWIVPCPTPFIKTNLCFISSFYWLNFTTGYNFILEMIFKYFHIKLKSWMRRPSLTYRANCMGKVY